MKKPPVTLENYQAVYEYYAQHRQNPVAWRLSHFVLGKLFRPNVTMAPGAAEEIERHLDRGNQLVVASNHVSDIDPPIIVATAERSPLKRIAGNTFIPSKYSLFRQTSLKGRVQRRAIDGLGAIPIFRNKDVRPDGSEVSEEQKVLQKAALSGLLETSIELINQGQNMAIFPEGERNPEDPANLLELGWGLGHIVCNADPKNDLAIVPMGIHYGIGEAKQAFTPSVHLGTPIPDSFTRPEEVISALKPVLQYTVDRAVGDFATRSA